MKFVVEAITGVARSCPQGAAALNHKLWDHAMKGESIVKRAFYFLPRARIFKFLGSFCEADEIRAWQRQHRAPRGH